MKHDLTNCCKQNGPTCCNNKKLWNLLKECAFVFPWFSQYMPIIALNHFKHLFFLNGMKSFLFEVRSEDFVCNLEIQHTALQKLTAKKLSLESVPSPCYQNFFIIQFSKNEIENTKKSKSKSNAQHPSSSSYCDVTYTVRRKNGSAQWCCMVHRPAPDKTAFGNSVSDPVEKNIPSER